MLPYVNAEAMSLHLQEISRSVIPGAHAVLVLDGAGWHDAAALTIPDNLSLRVWPGFEAIVETCCQAWNALMAMPERIASITRREWAKSVSA